MRYYQQKCQENRELKLSVVTKLFLHRREVREGVKPKYFLPQE